MDDNEFDNVEYFDFVGKRSSVEVRTWEVVDFRTVTSII